MNFSTVLYIQAIYFGITGIWPLLHIKSFMNVTGPKTDIWLVKTVGLLVSVVAATQAYALARADFSPTVAFMSLCACVCLMGVDIYYSLKGTISKVYLVDAVAEAGIIALWFLALRS